MAVTALMADVMSRSNEPNPDIEIGPRTTTAMAPPSSIRTHITNKNTNKPGFKKTHPS